MLIDSDDDPISLSCENSSFIEENNLELFNTITPVEPRPKKRKIIRKDIPKTVNRTLTFLEYYRTDIDLKSYKIVDLKAVASHNRLHISGNKTTLITRIFTYFQKNMSALKIQSNLRCFFVKRSFQLRGPAYHDHSLCVNDTDFYSLEPLTEIPFQDFFSFRDENSFIYGFNVCSLMALLVRKGRSILNPYNRAKIPEKVIGDMIRLYVYSVIFFPEHINDEDKCLRTRNLYIQSPNPMLIARGYYYGFQCSERYLNSLSRNRTDVSTTMASPTSASSIRLTEGRSRLQPSGASPNATVLRTSASGDDVQHMEIVTNIESSEEWMNRILNSPSTNVWLNEMLAPSRNSLPVGWDRNTTDDTTLTNSEDISDDASTTLASPIPASSPNATVLRTSTSGSNAVWFVNPIIQSQRMRVNTHIRFTDEDVPPFEELEDELPENPLRDLQNMDEELNDLERRMDNLERSSDQYSQVATSGRRDTSTTLTSPTVPTESSEETMHIQTMENRMREIVQQPILVRTQELFMEIDQLGNYTNVEWFHQLSKRDCFVFFEYMYNHWRYRGQLSSTVKKRICPLGDPFLGITNIRMRMNEITEEQLRFNCITVMERLAYTAYDIEDRKLAVLYILAALTQVSLPARNNMLWLYESMNL